VPLFYTPDSVSVHINSNFINIVVYCVVFYYIARNCYKIILNPYSFPIDRFPVDGVRGFLWSFILTQFCNKFVKQGLPISVRY
jgi:hypothetical protein